MQTAASPSIQPLLHDGFVLEVGGQVVSEFHSLTEALKAGLELKHRDGAAAVKVYDARDRFLDHILDRVQA